MGQIFELLNAGGIFMKAILATSIIVVAVVLQRAYSLGIGFRLNIEKLSAEVGKAVSAGDYPKAMQLCAGSHPLQKMMLAALMRSNRSEKEIRRAVETAAILELARFRRGSATLPQLSNLATLLGLLGTIHGLIISFSGMAGADAATRQAALSKGVAVAFYNTFFGLTVATITVVAYLVVSVKQGREMTRIEHALATLIDQLLLSPEARSAASPPALRISK